MSNEQIIRQQIRHKISPYPYFPPTPLIFDVKTDVNSQPYHRFFRGRPGSNCVGTRGGVRPYPIRGHRSPTGGDGGWKRHVFPDSVFDGPPMSFDGGEAGSFEYGRLRVYFPLRVKIDDW